MERNPPEILSSASLRESCDPSGSTEQAANDTLVRTIGEKAAGLLALPSAWAPDFVVIPTHVTDEARNQGTLTQLNVSFGQVIKHFGGATKLIVRSSSTIEGMTNRGRFDSVNVNDVSIEALTDAAKTILTAFARLEPNESCALLVHEYVKASCFGHLSNERRIGPKRKFLVESWTPSAGEPTAYSLQSNQKTELPNTVNPIPSEGRDARAGLRALCRWIDKSLGRAHVEWLVADDRILVVQCDREVTIGPSPEPMSEWTSLPPPSPVTGLQLLSEATEHSVIDLRKSRSVGIFKKLGLPTAPLYVLRDASVMAELSKGHVPDLLKQDLALLVTSPVTIRVDVVAAGHEDWQNLPASSPLHTMADAANFLASEIPEAAKRAEPRHLAVVFHHFLRARAGAWVECDPSTARVRIDATCVPASSRFSSPECLQEPGRFLRNRGDTSGTSR